MSDREDVNCGICFDDFSKTIKKQAEQIKKLEDKSNKYKEGFRGRAYGRQVKKNRSLQAELDARPPLPLMGESRSRLLAKLGCSNIDDAIKRIAEMAEQIKELEGKLYEISNLCVNCRNLDDAQAIAFEGTDYTKSTESGCQKCWVDKLQVENKRLRDALEKMLHSYDKHWTNYSLTNCQGITPTEVADSVVSAEEAFYGGKEK